ncbi:unnamed protein product [Pylaiella littoralis]
MAVLSLHLISAYLGLRCLRFIRGTSDTIPFSFDNIVVQISGVTCALTFPCSFHLLCWLTLRVLEVQVASNDRRERISGRCAVWSAEGGGLGPCGCSWRRSRIEGLRGPRFVGTSA